jgi:predicted MFS family arabinose efflux permease
MLFGMGAVTIATLLLGLDSPFTIVVILMALISLCLIIFVPAQQAFFGDRVPYAQRGRVMAAAELAWSLAFIVGLPLVGILIQFAGWRIGFAAIGILGIVAFVGLWITLPRDRRNVAHAAHKFGSGFAVALRNPMALAVVATTFLLAATNENLNVIFGVWMHDSFGLDPIALGFVASAIGVAEFASELFAAGFVDRIGKWRTVAASIALLGAANVLLPLLGVTAVMGTVGLVLIYFMFELAVVSALPLVSELAPTARATLLSMGIASFSFGRAVGSFTGPALYGNFGITATSLASAAGIGVALCIWLFLVREHRLIPQDR